MPKVFISYRRSDTPMVAGRLRESLARRLGDAAIFRDKDSIGAGEDWTKAIEASLSAHVVVLSLSGPGRVIPLLADGATMPREAELPESLRPLARSNALTLRDDAWDSDIERLTRAIGARGNSFRMRLLAVALTAFAVIVGGGAGYWWLRFSDAPVDWTTQPERGDGSSYREDIRGKLYDDLEQALKLLVSANPADKAKAIGMVDANLARISTTLESFPDDAYIHALAGYAAKNVFESSRGNDLLSAEQRQRYLVQARKHFEDALRLKPKDPSALNGMGNVSFYEGTFDAAIRYHELAIKEAGGSYPHAEHDLNLVSA